MTDVSSDNNLSSPTRDTDTRCSVYKKLTVSDKDKVFTCELLFLWSESDQ